MAWITDFLTRILRRTSDQQQSAESRAQTVPLEEPAPRVHSGRLPRHLEVGSAQSTGMERSHNEDALLTMVGSSDGEDALPDFGLFIVADGMGGHRSGEVASAISVRSVARHLTDRVLLRVMDLEHSHEPGPFLDAVKEALQMANHAVVDRVPGGGTTLTVAMLLGRQMTIGHVGDSRAYILQNDHLEPITRDHSQVNRLMELGLVSAEEAAVHPQRNILYRAIGQGANLEVDAFVHPIPSGGFLLICSDGLWGVVPDEEMLRIVEQADSPQQACEDLVRAANLAGGPDNITAVLIHFPPR
jgi:serine/threonine protein phosphatase PrpC